MNGAQAGGKEEGELQVDVPARTYSSWLLPSMHHSSRLCFGRAWLTSLDFAFRAFVDEPMGTGMAEAAVPYDQGSV